MQAHVGDRIIVRAHHLGEADKDCEVLEVHGEDGGPPYLVRWSDSGHEGLFFPGSDAMVVSGTARRGARGVQGSTGRAHQHVIG